MIYRDNYSQFPGHCRLCTNSNLPVIDTERDYDSDGFGGVLYICFACGTTMAQMFGYIAPERLADLEDELERTCQRLDEQETENADLAAQLSTYQDLVKITGAAEPEAPVKRGPGRPRKVV